MIDELIFTGKCHCESISYTFQSHKNINEIKPQSYDDCNFSSKQQAIHIFDPSATVEIFIREGLDPIKYVFGLKTAKFYICPICGSYVAAISKNGGNLFSAVNANLLDEEYKLNLPPTEKISLKGETRAGRTKRLIETWSPTTIHSKTLLEQMNVNTEEAFNNFSKQFQDHSLCKNKWTHEAHFIIALWYLLNHGYDQATELVREGIKSYNENTGVANTELDGYHETITMLYLKLVNKFIEEEKPSFYSESLLTKLLSSKFIEKDYPYLFYSKDLLLSKEARFSWVEPDLSPIR